MKEEERRGRGGGKVDFFQGFASLPCLSSSTHRLVMCLHNL